jgi:hypothetical protein
MSSKVKEPKKPFNLYSLLGRLGFGLVFFGSYALIFQILKGKIVIPDGSIVFKFLSLIRVSHYAPSYLYNFPNSLPLRVFMDYFPVIMISAILTSIVIQLICSIVFVAPKSSILDDPSSVIKHMGVDTPPLNHLKDLLLVCPEPDLRCIKEDVVISGMSVVAPASKAIDIVDAPSKEQLKTASDYDSKK